MSGDCLDVIKSIPDNSIDSIVTDPPYGLNFMNNKWDYQVPSIDIWKECLRVLKPGAHLLSFSSARTYHRMVVNVEDAGFEIRDQLMWVYGSGFPKSHNVGKSVDKLQGNDREVTGSRKQSGAKFKTWSDNPDETRWFNQGFNDQSRTSFETTKGNSEWEGWGTNLKPAHEPIVLARKPFTQTVAKNVVEWHTGAINIDECRVPLQHGETVTNNTFDNGAKPFGDAVGQPYTSRQNTEGRYPANFIHDGLDEEWSRYFYCPKANKKERGPDNTHPTVKPKALLSYLVKLVTPTDGVVLDPFMGSGTTGLACQELDKSFIGIELEPDYLEIAQARLKA